MKLIVVLFITLPLFSCASGPERNYTGSTPAGPVVRTFLGIPLTDSIDFIRWKLSFHGSSYELQCQYGIGKPNTNGFINGGKKIELNGELKKENDHYQLKNGNNILTIAELNDGLLHPTDGSKKLLVGTAGWSYTLNNTNTNPSAINSQSKPSLAFNDSLVFVGRTPCGIPGLIPNGEECYKLKWLVTLYAAPGSSLPGSYRILGTAWRFEAKTGTLEIIKGKNGQTIFQLKDGNKGFIHLIISDEHVLMFTDASGKLLIGNEDFSYTLNRRT